MNFVLLSLREFHALSEYSCSVPTSPRVGAKWRRGEPYLGLDERPKDWFLGEAVPHVDPGLVGIRWRRIFVIEWLAGDLLAEVLGA